MEGRQKQNNNIFRGYRQDKSRMQRKKYSMPKTNPLSADMFPELCVKEKKNERKRDNKPNYTDILKNKEKVERSERKGVKEGWVEKKKTGGEITYKYGKLKNKSTREIERETDEREREKIAKRIIMDREEMRAELNEIMGDMSPYCNWVLNPYEKEDEDERFRYESEHEEDYEERRYSSDEY